MIKFSCPQTSYKSKLSNKKKNQKKLHKKCKYFLFLNQQLKRNTKVETNPIIILLVTAAKIIEVVTSVAEMRCI